MLDGTDSHEPAKSFLNCQTSIIICQNYGFQEVNKSIKSKRRKTWDNAIKEFINLNENCFSKRFEFYLEHEMLFILLGRHP